jgi:hypothetical protein
VALLMSFLVGAAADELAQGLRLVGLGVAQAPADWDIIHTIVV